MVNEKPFKLDMPFEEALRRFAQTEEKELPERGKLKRKRVGGEAPPTERKRKEKRRQSGG
jgi:hypothetical protein